MCVCVLIIIIIIFIFLKLCVCVYVFVCLCAWFFKTLLYITKLLLNQLLWFDYNPWLLDAVCNQT